MTEFGYWLSSEEHTPRGLVTNAVKAEEAGFTFAMISDHFHPWIDSQGQSPFVWSVIGAIANATEKLTLGTGVTCPLIRTHPAIIGQAAATSAALMPGRFFLGLGTGENLNEHVTGARWPAPDERIEMLAEAIEVLRLLWQGGEQTHRGRHYTVDHARIYTLPEEPIPIAVAAAKPQAAELAGRLGEGFVTTDPSAELLEAYRAAGGDGPRYGQVKLCWAESEQEAKKLVHELWPTSALAGTQGQELPRPSDFEAAVETLTEEQTTAETPCGPDPEPVLAAIGKWEKAGFDHIALHQVGPDQDGFLRFWREELQPRLG